MKNGNVILQAAIASALLAATASANAGALGTTFKTYASEVFGTGSNATAVTPSSMTYQFGVPVGASQTISLYTQLSGGALFVGGKVAVADLKCLDAANAVISSATVAPAGVVTSAAISTDSTYAVFTVNTGASGLNTNSTCTYIPQAVSVNNLASALSTSGGVVTATWTNDTGAAALGGVPTGGTNIDAAGTHTGNIAQSAAAITGKYIASSNFPFTPSGGGATGTAETKQIDVAASPSQSAFTAGTNGVATNRVNLGALLWTNTPGTQDDGTGADYTIAKATATGLSAVITGNFSLAEAAAGSKGTFLASDLGCTAQIAAPAAAAVTYNTGKTTATISGGTIPTVNVPSYVCMSVSPTNTTAITPTAYSATASLAKTAATELADTVASTPLLATALNGSTVDVRTYVPAAVAGYSSYIRVINTGAVAAPFSAAIIDPVTGVTGASSVVISSLAAGAATTLTASQIEAAVGAISATSRPRIRITAPTDKMSVQSFVTNPNGTFTTMHGAD